MVYKKNNDFYVQAATVLNKFQRNFRKYDICLLSVEQLENFLDHSELSFLKAVTQLESAVIPDHDTIANLLCPYSLWGYSKRFVRVEPQVWQAFCQLRDEIRRQTGQTIYIISGYRSPAYQSMFKLKDLYNSETGSLPTTELPYRSEHCHLPFHAIDISQKKNAFKLDDEIVLAINKYAARSGFSISYQQGNHKGIIAEPWHLYLKKT